MAQDNGHFMQGEGKENLRVGWARFGCARATHHNKGPGWPGFYVDSKPGRSEGVGRRHTGQ